MDFIAQEPNLQVYLYSSLGQAYLRFQWPQRPYS